MKSLFFLSPFLVFFSWAVYGEMTFDWDEEEEESPQEQQPQGGADLNLVEIGKYSSSNGCTMSVSEDSTTDPAAKTIEYKILPPEGGAFTIRKGVKTSTPNDLIFLAFGEEGIIYSECALKKSGDLFIEVSCFGGGGPVPNSIDVLSRSFVRLFFDKDNNDMIKNVIFLQKRSSFFGESTVPPFWLDVPPRICTDFNKIEKV